MFSLTELALDQFDFHVGERKRLFTPTLHYPQNQFKKDCKSKCERSPKNLLDKNKEEYLHVLGVGRDLSEDTNTKQRGNFDKMGCIQIRIFHHQKAPVRKMTGGTVKRNRNT